jgi:hypothetical protein
MSGDPFVARAAQMARFCSWSARSPPVEPAPSSWLLARPARGRPASARSSLASRQRCRRLVTVLGRRGRPLWPWSDLVVELSNQQNVTAEPDPAVEPLDRFGLFRAVAEQLRGLCERRPAIALINDPHGANQDVGVEHPLRRAFAAPLPVAVGRRLADRDLPGSVRRPRGRRPGRRRRRAPASLRQRRRQLP